MGAAGGWVSKEALATTPKEVLRFRIWITALWASCCGGLHGVNTANISGIMSMKPFKKDFGLDEMTSSQVTDWSGWAVSSMLLVSLKSPTKGVAQLSMSRDNSPECLFLGLLESVTGGKPV